MAEQKIRTASRTVPSKKLRDYLAKDMIVDNLDTRRNLVMEADKEELISLRKQVEDLCKTIIDKDDFLCSVDNLNSQVSCAQEELVELKNQSEEKDACLKATQLQLSNAKIELADKQAAIEKKHWEGIQSSKRLEELKEAVDHVNRERSMYSQLFEYLMKKDDFDCVDNYDIQPCLSVCLPQLNDMDDSQMLNVEEARKAYMNALAIAKRNDGENSIADVIMARLHLQSLVFQNQGGEPKWV